MHLSCSPARRGVLGKVSMTAEKHLLRAGVGRPLPPVQFEAVCIAQRNPCFLLGLTNRLLASGEPLTSQDSLCE